MRGGRICTALQLPWTDSRRVRTFGNTYLLFSGFALALAWVFDGAVFGSFSCLEGQFPKVFPFTLIKSVD
jgi:hypothetical protein